ncbi:MAG: hypothetical protein VKK42_04705, partial [Lyngbya sp.]|nr:hypothetical protein [Lyngbya sp.]
KTAQKPPKNRPKTPKKPPKKTQKPPKNRPQKTPKTRAETGRIAMRPYQPKNRPVTYIYCYTEFNTSLEIGNKNLIDNKMTEIILDSEQENLLQEQLKTGKYTTPNEVITDALKALAEKQKLNQSRQIITLISGESAQQLLEEKV